MTNEQLTAVLNSIVANEPFDKVIASMTDSEICFYLVDNGIEETAENILAVRQEQITRILPPVHSPARKRQMITIESILNSLKTHGKLNETTYVQQSRIDFWTRQKQLVDSGDYNAAFERLQKHDDDYDDQFQAVTNSATIRAKRIWAMDGQLNAIRRVWFVPANKRQTGATTDIRSPECYRVWQRLVEIAETFEYGSK